MQEHLANKQLFWMHFWFSGLDIILILVTLLKSDYAKHKGKTNGTILKTENQPKTLLVYTEINHTKLI